MGLTEASPWSQTQILQWSESGMKIESWLIRLPCMSLQVDEAFELGTPGFISTC